MGALVVLGFIIWVVYLCGGGDSYSRMQKRLEKQGREREKERNKNGWSD